MAAITIGSDFGCLKKSPNYFPQQLYHFTFPSVTHRSSDYSTSLPTPVLCFLTSSHPSVCDLVPHCGLTCISLMMSDTIFSCADWLFVCLAWRNASWIPLPIFLNIHFYLLIWLRQISVGAWWIFSCSMWNLVPQTTGGTQAPCSGSMES